MLMHSNIIVPRTNSTPQFASVPDISRRTAMGQFICPSFEQTAISTKRQPTDADITARRPRGRPKKVQDLTGLKPEDAQRIPSLAGLKREFCKTYLSLYIRGQKTDTERIRRNYDKLHKTG
jgi:hypothetical protein